jgi:Type II secretion system (T2SS), protein N
MKGKRWIALGIVAAALGAVAFIPAHSLEAMTNARLAAKFGKALSVAEMSGTIWSGNGNLKIGITNRPITVPITWQFASRSLLGLRAGFDVKAQSEPLSGGARIGMGMKTIEISNTDVAADATLIAAFNNLASFAAPRGTLRLMQKDNEHVTFAWWGGQSVNGALQAKAENLAIATLSPRPIGTYDVNITFRETLAEYAFTNASGALTFDGGGQIRFQPTREFQYNGHAKPSREVPYLLAALLPLGRPTLDGRVLINYKTAW